MPREIETKIRLAEPDPLRSRLQESGAARAARFHETSRIFDTRDRRLLAADCGLRVRESRALDGQTPPEATLTFKGPRDAGKIKAREEIETRVADAAALIAILRRLGFDEVIRYEKRRETWQLGPCTVCLDELPQLGWFAEIEGPGVTAIETAAARLELADSVPLRETYVELAATFGHPDDTGCRRLLFR